MDTMPIGGQLRKITNTVVKNSISLVEPWVLFIQYDDYKVRPYFISGETAQRINASFKSVNGKNFLPIKDKKEISDSLEGIKCKLRINDKKFGELTPLSGELTNPTTNPTGNTTGHRYFN